MEHIKCRISKTTLEKPYGQFELMCKLKAAGIDITKPYEWSDDASLKTNERVYKQDKLYAG